MDIMKRYKLMREAGKTLYGKVLKVVPKHIFMQVANEFRFLEKRILVCDESDLDIMENYAIYFYKLHKMYGQEIRFEDVI